MAGTGLPRWPSSKESACQRKRCKFNPWIRKIPWRRKWQSTPVFLLGKCHGQRSLARYSPWGHTESDTTEQLSTHTHQGLNLSFMHSIAAEKAIKQHQKIQNTIEGLNKWKQIDSHRWGAPISSREQVSQNESRKVSANPVKIARLFSASWQANSEIYRKSKGPEAATAFWRTHLGIKL